MPAPLAEAPLPFYIRHSRSFRQQSLTGDPPLGLALDELLILPGPSQVASSREVSTRTELVKGFPLAIPIVSANMDTVTEAPMAEFMARIGGIGILHRAMTIPRMIDQVGWVKDAFKYIVEDPPIVDRTANVGLVRYLMKERRRGFVVVAEEGKLLSLVTTRDLPDELSSELLVTGNTPWGTPIMVPRENIIVARPGISVEEAVVIMHRYKIEKLPVVDEEGNIGGVITERDYRNIKKYPDATVDSKGRLRVGVAVGVDFDDYPERITAAVEAGADVLCVDVLHGDSPQVYNVIKYSKHKFPDMPVIAGNVGTGRSTGNLVKAGADAVKTGYGDGSLCTTQLHTGTGAKHGTAIADSAAEVVGEGVKIIADGGIRKGGDIAKALALGADTVMIGSLLGGTDQSPGEVRTDDLTKDRYKDVRGMATQGAEETLAASKGKVAKKRSPQGISARVVYQGDAEPLILGLMDGLRHGIANTGAVNIVDLRNQAVFERQSVSGQQEGQPHIIFNAAKR